MITVLKVIRMAKNITQAEAAKKVRISQGWYSLIESRRLAPTEAIKERLSQAFNMPADKLLQEADIESITNK